MPTVLTVCHSHHQGKQIAESNSFYFSQLIDCRRSVTTISNNSNNLNQTAVYVDLRWLLNLLCRVEISLPMYQSNVPGKELIGSAMMACFLHIVVVLFWSLHTLAYLSHFHLIL